MSTESREPILGNAWNNAASPNPKPMQPLTKKIQKPWPLTPAPAKCAQAASSNAAKQRRQKFASVPPSIFDVRCPHTAEMENKIVVRNAAHTRAGCKPV